VNLVNLENKATRARRAIKERWATWELKDYQVKVGPGASQG